MSRKSLNQKVIGQVFAEQAEALPERCLRVLSAVVEGFVRNGEPVGSRAVAQASGLGLSSATIRHVMAELEDLGYLAQPHASAGRVPTDLGYQAYAQRVLAKRRSSRRPASRLACTRDAPWEVTELLEFTSRALSRLGHGVGLVLRPRLATIRLRSIQFVRLQPRRVVAMVIGDGGVVKDGVFQPSDDYGQDELTRIGEYLVNRYAGWTLEEVAKALVDEVTQARAASAAAMQAMVDLARRCLLSCMNTQDIIVDGAAVGGDAIGFDDIEQVRSLLRTVEQKDRIVRLLQRCLEHDGVQVCIGGGSPKGDLAELSGLALVATQYGDGEVFGSVGILGPVRMPYAHVISVVEDVARDVGSALRVGVVQDA